MATLYCRCGHRVWSDLWWNGKQDELRFVDDKKTSETYGERLRYCPGCGNILSPGSVSSEYSDH